MGQGRGVLRPHDPTCWYQASPLLRGGSCLRSSPALTTQLQEPGGPGCADAPVGSGLVQPLPSPPGSICLELVQLKPYRGLELSTQLRASSCTQTGWVCSGLFLKHE